MTIVRYIVVHDCGRMINPPIVDGQVQGGRRPGSPATRFLERIEFDREAQPLTTTLADYMIAGACDLPSIAILHLDSPTAHNPLGVKGVGESGYPVPATAAVAAAIEDAQAPLRGRGRRSPGTPRPAGPSRFRLTKEPVEAGHHIWWSIPAIHTIRIANGAGTLI